LEPNSEWQLFPIAAVQIDEFSAKRGAANGHKRTLHGGDRHSKDETEEVVVQGLAQFLGGPHNKRSPLHN
jgi:hypothetical protein